MARIRTIKPEFFTSLTIAALPLAARMTFIGLWTHVDDSGRCVDDTRLVRAAIWALDDRTLGDVDDDLKALYEAGLIYRYEVSQRRFLEVSGWAEHQKISHPTESRLPARPAPEDGPDGPRGGLRGISGGLREDSGGRREASPDPSKTSPEGRRNDPSTGALYPRGVEGRKARSTTMNVDGLDAKELASTSENTSLPESSREIPEGSESPRENFAPERKGKEQGKEQGKEHVRDRAAPSPDAETGEDAHSAPRDEPRRIDIERVCSHLAERVASNGSKRPTINDGWRDAARLMIDRDKRTVEQILRAIDWCQDDTFWRGNVMSMPKLREKYDQLRLQASRPATRRDSATPSTRHIDPLTPGEREARNPFTNAVRGSDYAKGAS